MFSFATADLNMTSSWFPGWRGTVGDGCHARAAVVVGCDHCSRHSTYCLAGGLLLHVTLKGMEL